MTPSPAESGDYRVAPELYQRLAIASPGERGALVLGLINGHPQGRLVLPGGDDGPAVLDGVVLGKSIRKRRSGGASGSAAPSTVEQSDVSLRGAILPGVRLRRANLAGVDLTEADLRGAALGEANLRGANLENADLRGADLAGANLRGAALGGANLGGAMLEDADMQGANLRFSLLEDAVLENADLRGADLWGVHLAGADLSGANMRRVVLREADLKGANLSRVDLRSATLGKSDFGAAKLVDADLRGADLRDATFRGARLSGAKLQGLDLSGCDITGIHVSGAWLEKAHFNQGQFGGAIGEELVGEYGEAKKGYLALERAFQDLGDPDASSWAYRRRRRMQKREALGRASSARSAGRWREAARAYALYASDQFVEWLCDYGESVPRVLGSLLMIYFLFTLVYGLTGSVVRVVETQAGQVHIPTSDLLDLATFSLLAMSTSGSPTVDLLPRDRSVHFLTATEALIGIALTGLLGFVLGNRIRR